MILVWVGKEGPSGKSWETRNDYGQTHCMNSQRANKKYVTQKLCSQRKNQNNQMHCGKSHARTPRVT